MSHDCEGLDEEKLVEEYIEMLHKNSEVIEELGLRTLPSDDNDTEHPLTINMSLAEKPFYMMARGEKTLEVRLYDEKRRRIAVGDKLQLELSTDTTKYLIAYVVALHRAASFTELFSSPLLESAGFGGLSPEEASEAMRAYYPRARELEYGVLGIELEIRHVCI